MFANAILQNVSLEMLNSWIPAAIGQYYVIDSSHSGQNGGEIKEDNVGFRQWWLGSIMFFIEVGSLGFDWWECITGVDIGLVSGRRQATIWTNDGSFGDAYLGH